MSYQEEAIKILLEFMDSLDKVEKKSFILLSNKWGVLSKDIEKEIKRLIDKSVTDGGLTKNQIFRLSEYIDFLSLTERKINEFNLIVDGSLRNSQMIFGKAGITMTEKQIGLLNVNFHKINPNLVNNFIGKSYSDGSLLMNILKTSYPETSEKLTDTLLSGIALGKHPEVIAREMIKQDLNLPLSRALRISRTESMNILRETSIKTMKTSGVCKGWIRIEQSDACDECKAENGKHFSFGAIFEAHPNCRGAAIPDV